MSVKVVEIYPGKWYVRVVYKNFRKTKRIGSRERAIEVGRKLTTALELYGFDVEAGDLDGDGVDDLYLASRFLQDRLLLATAPSPCTRRVCDHRRPRRAGGRFPH